MSGMNSEAYWENLVKRSLCRFLLLWKLAEEPLFMGMRSTRPSKTSARDAVNPRRQWCTRP